LAECRFDLSGEWEGWKIRGRYLVAPGGAKLSVRQVNAYATQARYGFNSPSLAPMDSGTSPA